MNVSLDKVSNNRVCQEKLANCIVNLLISSTFFRECVRIAEASGIENIPTYSGFLLKSWPTHGTASKILHHTGPFRIRRASTAVSKE